MSEYGETHQEARKEAMIRGQGKCAVTKEKGKLDSHHLFPKSLQYETFGDNPDNYILLLKNYHKLLHDICNIDQSLVLKRKKIADKIYKDPTDVKSIQELNELDREIIPIFVANTIHKLPFDIEQTIVTKMLESAFLQQTDLMIKLHAQKKITEVLEHKLQKIQNAYSEITSDDLTLK